MSDTLLSPKTALKYETEVQANGLVELHVPFQPGARLIIFVIEETADPFRELLQAAESSLDFWDHPFDDEDWNNA